MGVVIFLSEAKSLSRGRPSKLSTLLEDTTRHHVPRLPQYLLCRPYLTLNLDPVEPGAGAIEGGPGNGPKPGSPLYV